jgi:hypothetical protein
VLKSLCPVLYYQVELLTCSANPTSRAGLHWTRRLQECPLKYTDTREYLQYTALAFVEERIMPFKSQAGLHGSVNRGEYSSRLEPLQPLGLSSKLATTPTGNFTMHVKRCSQLRNLLLWIKVLRWHRVLPCCRDTIQRHPVTPKVPRGGGRKLTHFLL